MNVDVLIDVYQGNIIKNMLEKKSVYTLYTDQEKAYISYCINIHCGWKATYEFIKIKRCLSNKETNE